MPELSFVQIGDMQEENAKDLNDLMINFESKIKTW